MSADLAKRGHVSGNLSGRALEAHLRMASLPTVRHVQEHVDPMIAVRRAGNEAANRARLNSGKSFRAATSQPLSLNGSSPPKAVALPSERKATSNVVHRVRLAAEAA